MKHKSVLARLYYTLIHADQKMNEREVILGRQMVQCEGILESSFNNEVASLTGRPAQIIFKETVEGLKRLDVTLQIRCIAWMCVIANADGFMDKKEWQFIYQLYHKELNLPLDQIMKVQGELLKRVHEGAHGMKSSPASPGC